MKTWQRALWYFIAMFAVIFAANIILIRGFGFDQVPALVVAGVIGFTYAFPLAVDLVNRTRE